jgi:hypothetical protein
MKIYDKIGFQGDVCFVRIGDALPSGVKERPVEGRVVVAHSETGHHHAIEPGEARLFEKLERDPMLCYLQATGEYMDVVHHRSTDTHETVRLLAGCWEVRRQEELTPAGWARVDD